MSRIGKLPIKIPNNVTVEIDDNREVKVKGPKGALEYNFGYEVGVKQQEDGSVVVEKQGKTKEADALWGTARSIIDNLVKGVSEGFKKELELNGVGYKMQIQGNKLVLNLGFSHPIEKEIPEGVELEVEKNILKVVGADKQQVGQFAAEVRSYRKVEPYKGKGFKYVDEQVIRKEGKRATATE